MADALGTPGGVVSAKDHRLDQGGMLAAQGPTTLDVRTGVMWGPGTTTLVTGTSATGTMTVSIAAHHAVTSRGAGDGPYLGPTLETSTTVNIGAAPGSNSRIDVVYAKQGDANSTISPDGSSVPIYGVQPGVAAATPTKPSLSGVVGAVEIATVTVASTATSTNGAGVTIAQTALQTVARGAPVPVRNQTERDALTKFPNLLVSRLDTGDVEMVNLANSGFVTVFDQVVAATPYLFTVLATAGSSIPNATWSDIPFDSDDFDVSGWHPVSPYPANATATVNATGWYFVQASISWAANATGNRAVRILKNSAPVRGSGVVIPTAGLSFITSTTSPLRRVFLNSGDILKVQGYQNSGGTLGLREVTSGAEEQLCFFEVKFDRT